jgi:hypothetical protein
VRGELARASKAGNAGNADADADADAARGRPATAG